MDVSRSLMVSHPCSNRPVCSWT